MADNKPGRNQKKPEAVSGGQPFRQRRVYERPRLIEWGTLQELTAGGVGDDADFDVTATKAV